MVHKKAKLVLLTGGKIGLEYPVSKIKSIIGRELTCNIALEEPVLSRKHCAIYEENSEYFIIDLDSKNGTFLNAKKIVKSKLENGDIIRIGNTRFEFVTPNVKSGDKSEFIMPKSATERKTSFDQMTGKKIKNYEIIELIGEGGMGSVYKAWDQEHEMWTAIKLMSKSAAMEEDQVQRFNREFETGKLLVHQNIVQVLDFGKYQKSFYLVMEYVEGYGLQDFLELRGRLTARGALKVALQIARALEYAFTLNIIHRDIKPDNILITPKGVVKILDLGLAKKIKEKAGESSITQRGEGIGTLHYMSPEQTINARDTDQRTDIYSLGATIYHMIAGNPPFDAEGIWEFVDMIQNTPPQPLFEIVKDLPSYVWDVVEKALRKNPAKRYQYPSEFRIDLENCLQRIPKNN